MGLPVTPVTGIPAGPAIRPPVSLEQAAAGIFWSFWSATATKEGLFFHGFLTP
jgi:hypothetical protein